MFSKILIIFASLYVINASVITINVFDDNETEVAHKPRGCNIRSCEQLCRRLGFSGGACIHGRCKCDNFQHTEESLSKHEESVSPRDCNYRACDQLCRNLGFTGGACVNGRCDCDNFLHTEGKVSETAETVADSSDAITQRDCNFRACDQLCRRLGFTGGACVNGRCDCDNFLSTEDGYSETGQADSAEPLSTRNCDYNLCNQRCQRLGYTGGICVHDHCKCNPRTVGGADKDTAESYSQRGCNLRTCNQQCHRFGFTGGACVNGHCKCDNLLKIEDDVAETGDSQRGCIFRVCDKQCRRYGFNGGTCVNGRCKCENAEDPSSMNDATSNEDEETNLVIRTNEGDLTLSSLRACNTASCNEMCRVLNYAGGLCSGGVCNCY